MKFNKWTVGLAAVGAVSLVSAAKAEETLSAVQTALSSTTISGYVDTSFEWQFESDKGTPALPFSIPFRSGKENGFNLNVVKLSVEKPMDETEWAAGYKVDLLFGPDAVGYNPSANGDQNESFGIKQAYVAVRTPVGNGIDWKMGVFDTIIGYEVFDSGSNPNFTRSWGYAVEPTQHTGLLGSYRVNDVVSFSAGLANTLSAGINTRDTSNVGPNGENESINRKTWMASVAVTAPDSTGFLAGSTFYGGIVNGFAGGDEDQANYYVGGTISTPVEGLRAGAAFDYVTDAAGADGDDIRILGLYTSYQATEKLSLHGRVEFGKYDFEKTDVFSLTATAQYNLWNNVISRVEIRYDKLDGGVDEDGVSYDEEGFGAYFNLIYQF